MEIGYRIDKNWKMGNWKLKTKNEHLACKMEMEIQNGNCKWK